RVALPFYDQTLPMGTSLFAEPELLARHQEQLRQKKVGPHRAIEEIAAYVRAEQRLGRINARVDPEATAALLTGACVGRALIRRFLGEQDEPSADERFIRSIVRTLIEGLAPQTRD